MITPAQIRGARAIAGLTQSELAKRSGMSTTGLSNIERGEAEPKASTVHAIRAALEAAGVMFIDPNGNGPGVRLALGGATPEFAPGHEARGKGIISNEM